MAEAVAGKDESSSSESEDELPEGIVNRVVHKSKNTYSRTSLAQTSIEL